MSKQGVLTRVLQVRVSWCVLVALAALVTAQFFLNYGLYNFNHIPTQSIPNALYKATNPSLKKKPDIPDCKYDHILSSTESINGWEVPEKYDDFSVKGLVNGSFVPDDCNPLFSVAILVPYRNREGQLKIFLPYMHNFLRKQNIHYKLYVIEQDDNNPWNKGLLFNVGAREAIAEGFPCLVLHDVDVLPLAASDLYVCLQQPRHVSASIDAFRSVLLYERLVGGALAITAQHYRSVDGYSNSFLGWGGEDDDFADRLLANDLEILRLGREVSRHTMLRHGRAARGDSGAGARRGWGGLGRAALLEAAPPHVAAHALCTSLAVRTKPGGGFHVRT